jgi:hypothetical protein
MNPLILLIVSLVLLFGCLSQSKTKESFLTRLPYLSLDNSSNYNKYTGKKEPKGTHLGYSIYGRRYADHYNEAKKRGSQTKYDLREESEESHRYPEWYDYEATDTNMNHGPYIGYPWYYY